MTNPGTMRAVFFEGPRTMTLREAPIPQPGPGWVRLRVRYCGICGSDVSLYKTGATAGPDVVLGHEISAVVDVDRSGRLEPGTRVVPFPARGCGECLWCREGHPRYCLSPPERLVGGYAEYTSYPSTGLIPVPEDLDDRTAAMTEPFGVALRGVEEAALEPDELVYVSGLGSIGSFAVSGLVAMGCRVIGADPREDRRSLGRELGCEIVIDPTAEDPYEATLSVDPHGARASFECSGVPEALPQAFEACGRLGVVGIIGMPMVPVLLMRMALREQRAFALAGPTMVSMGRALALLLERPQIAKVISGTVPLEQTGEAMEMLTHGHGGPKVLVAPAG